METVISESKFLKECDYVFFNENIEDSVNTLKDMIYVRPLNLKLFDDERFREEAKSILGGFN